MSCKVEFSSVGGCRVQSPMAVGALVVVPEQVDEDGYEEESCMHRYAVLQGKRV